MYRTCRLLLIAGIALGTAAFACGLLAVWSDTASEARAHWGGTSAMCALASFVLLIAAAASWEDSP